jgi:phosphatidylserine/phosphatidylglycerophosphate/cardiolipin synthase-like enzyme
MPISKPLFEFAAAARATDLLNFPHRFHRAIDILDDKTGLSFSNNFGDRTAMEND